MRNIPILTELIELSGNKDRSIVRHKLVYDPVSCETLLELATNLCLRDTRHRILPKNVHFNEK